MRHDDRRVVVCQLRREDEGIAAFGLTGEGDEDGSEHPFTVGPAVATAIRDRTLMRLWQSRSHLARRHRWTPPRRGGRLHSMDATDNPRIVIAGGGVAALEACLALRDRLSAADLDITLLTPAERFDYRPLSVLEPFRGISRWSISLATFAADQDITVIHDALTAVAPHARRRGDRRRRRGSLRHAARRDRRARRRRRARRADLPRRRRGRGDPRAAGPPAAEHRLRGPARLPRGPCPSTSWPC